MTCETCRCDKVCDHNRFGFENCNNYVPEVSASEGEREKLTELMGLTQKILCVPIGLTPAEANDLICMQIVDSLLENGVIVPPCKVGQTVYVVNSLWVSEYTVEAVWWDGLMYQFKAENEEYADECSVFYFFDERIGKTVFLSREDAEKALKGGEG